MKRILFTIFCVCYTLILSTFIVFSSLRYLNLSDFELKELYDDNIQTTVIVPDSEYFSWRKLDDISVEYFTEEQIDEYLGLTGKEPIRVYLKGRVAFIGTEFSSYFSDIGRSSGASYRFETAYEYLLSSNFDGIIERKNYLNEEELSVVPDKRFLNKSLCRLPSTSREIAITDLKFEFFQRYGYNDDGVKTNILYPDDLIGKKIGDFTIVGVYSIEENLDRLKDVSVANYGYKYVENYVNGYNLSNFAILSEEYFSAEGFNQAVYGIFYKLSGDIAVDKTLLQRLSYTKYSQRFKTFYRYSAKIRSDYSGYSKLVETETPKPIVLLFWLFAITFLVVAIFVFAKSFSTPWKNFRIFSTSFGFECVTDITVWEKSIFAALNAFFSSIVLSLIANIAVNVYYGVSLLKISFLSIAITFLFTIVITSLSASRAVKRLKKNN